MTDTGRALPTEFGSEFDALCQKHGLGFDDALEVLSDAVQADAERQDHPAVKSSLEAACEQLRHAAFNIYASYK